VKIKIIQPAGPNARFAPNAFADTLGCSHPSAVHEWPSGRQLTETLVDAKVSEDGTEAELTIELDGPFLPPAPPGSYSFEG
jgi:hypothetical protein